DAVNVAGALTEHVILVEGIGEQPAVLDKRDQRIGGGEPVPRRKLDDQSAMHIGEGIERDDEAVATGARELLDRAFDSGGTFCDAVDKSDAARLRAAGDA